MRNHVSTCRIRVGQLSSFCLNHLNHKDKLISLVPRAGLTAWQNHAPLLKTNLLKSQQLSLTQNGRFRNVAFARVRKSIAIPRNGTCRISCRITSAYFSFYAHMAAYYSYHNLRNVGGRIMEFIEITVRNFKALVKRNDITNPQWFAMPIDILEHPDFFDISGDEFKAFAWVMGVAAKLNSETVRIYPALCERRIAIKKKSVELTISKLNGKRWDVTQALRECYAGVTLQDSTEQDKTVQYRTEQGLTKVSGNRLICLWNEHCQKLPRVEVETAERAKKSKALLTKYGEEKLITAITRVASSDFCNGLGSTGWVCDFDFFVRPATYPKIIEGKYDNRTAKKPQEQFKNAHLLKLLTDPKEGA